MKSSSPNDVPLIPFISYLLINSLLFLISFFVKSLIIKTDNREIFIELPSIWIIIKFLLIFVSLLSKSFWKANKYPKLLLFSIFIFFICTLYFPNKLNKLLLFLWILIWLSSELLFDELLLFENI